MQNSLKAIYKFQVDAGLANKDYDDFLESSFQIEEALEGFENLSYLATKLVEDKSESITSQLTAKDIARQIITLAKTDSESTAITDVDRLDKACDAIVFAIGSMSKLGLSPQEINKALNIVNHANQQKLSMPKDKYGKLSKPENFVNPEPELQKILDTAAMRKGIS